MRVLLRLLSLNMLSSLVCRLRLKHYLIELNNLMATEFVSIAFLYALLFGDKNDTLSGVE